MDLLKRKLDYQDILLERVYPGEYLDEDEDLDELEQLERKGSLLREKSAAGGGAQSQMKGGFQFGLERTRNTRHDRVRESI